MTISLYGSACRYLAAGFSLIPCTLAKKPAIKSWKHYTHLRPSEDDLKFWFAKDGHSIGLVCGHVSQNLVVVDLDGQPAVDLFKKQFPLLTETATVLSGSKLGAHFYYRVENVGENVNVRIPNVGGFEIRGNGQYVIAPPSWHPSGNRYQTINPVPIMRLDDLAPVRAWLNSLRDKVRAKEKIHVGTGRLSPRPTSSNGLSAYMSSVFEGELWRVRNASVGSRNNSLFYAGLRLANYAAGGELAWRDCENALLDAALDTGMEMNEVVRTIASAYNIGSHSPRQQPRRRG